VQEAKSPSFFAIGVWKMNEISEIEEVEKVMKEIENIALSLSEGEGEKLRKLSEKAWQMSEVLSRAELKLLNENNPAILANAIAELVQLLRRAIELLPELIRPHVYEPEYP
jgi:hypothetical protein